MKLFILITIIVVIVIRKFIRKNIVCDYCHLYTPKKYEFKFYWGEKYRTEYNILCLECKYFLDMEDRLYLKDK